MAGAFDGVVCALIRPTTELRKGLIMFELTLDNGASGTELVSFDDVNQIHDWDDLSNLFDGKMYLDIDAEDLVDYETYGTTSPDEAIIKPVIKARWAFADGDTAWRMYIQSEMNDLEISGVQGLLEGGVASGYTELMFSNYCYEVISTHIREIEDAIDDIAKDTGSDFWDMFEDGFDFQKLTWYVFEGAVRRIIEGDLGFIL